MTDDEDGPLLFSDDDLEDVASEDPNPKGPERFLSIDGHEVPLTREQYDRVIWWLVCSETDAEA